MASKCLLNPGGVNLTVLKSFFYHNTREKKALKVSIFF